MPEGKPEEWDPTEIEEFAGSVDAPELASVVEELYESGSPAAIGVLTQMLGFAGPHLYAKPFPSQLATRGLLAIGPEGVKALREALLNPDTRVRYATAALATLWRVARGEGFAERPPRESGELLELEISEETQESAGEAISDILAEAFVDEHAFYVVSWMFSLAATDLPGAGFTPADAMGLISEASILLSRSVLDEFSRLIDAEEREEEYQGFLAEHPVLIDPLAAEVRSKQRLGVEYATDFVIRRYDNRWILVEIERPQDRLFNQGHDLSQRFVHAFGQVVDFQSWVDNNVAYAQAQMPKISNPAGVLIIGLRSQLEERDVTKLRAFTANSRRIEVMTYDDLLTRGNALYENLRHRKPE